MRKIKAAVQIVAKLPASPSNHRSDRDRDGSRSALREMSQHRRSRADAGTALNVLHTFCG
jgi:hypothetical protein